MRIESREASVADSIEPCQSLCTTSSAETALSCWQR
jgi:hypothetical protein